MQHTTLAAPRRPLVPDDLDPIKSLGRAAWAAARTAKDGGYNGDVCRRIFPNDPVARAILTRAATTGATTTDPAWAGALATRAVGQWLPSLAPASAAAELIRRGIRVSVTEGIPFSIPRRATPPAAAPFVGEGGAIPVRAWSLTTADLSPRKMAVIVVFSKELSQHSDAQAIFTEMLNEEAAVSLDAAYFGTQAASASAHAGLLNGVTPLTGGADMAADLTKLAAAVGAGGSGQVVYITGPGRAATVPARTPEVTVTILPSLVVPEDRVIAVDPVSLIHGFGGDPIIEASDNALLHLEDTTPLNIATGAQGSGVLATPTQSMFQTDQISLRMLLDIAFAKRRANCVAFLNGATW